VTNAVPALGWGIVVAVSLLAGGAAAAAIRLSARVAAALSAFGGGILLAAVALELVPEADREGGSLLTTLGLLAGTLVFVGADAWITSDDAMESMRRAGHAAAAGRPMVMPGDHSEAARGEAIAAGLFIDGVPESFALGLTIAERRLGAALLAGIVVGNVVEAYGAAQPLIAGGRSRRFAVTLLAGIGLLLGCATLAGGTALSGASPGVVGSAQAVAAGAVLAVISISIIPHAFAEVSGVVAVAAVSGFICGYLLS
jgi:ZIP family zinc transporter